MDFSKEQLLQLCNSVFPYLDGDNNLAVLVDLPCPNVPDNEMWSARRNIALEWYHSFQELLVEQKIRYKKVSLIVYENVKSNNADLPDTFYIATDNISEISQEMESITQQELFHNYQVFMALTEFSTTAPLKIAAKKYGFRGATMSGFSLEMIPALCLDYEIIHERLSLLKEKLDRAQMAIVSFEVCGEYHKATFDNQTNEYGAKKIEKENFEMIFDLRYRSAHVSAGRFPEKAMVGNLPSGETYIVPHEGEQEKSKTQGILPVQFEDEVVLYSVKENKASDILSRGDYSEQEKQKLQAEPAYGNIAELGFGILSDFGIAPIGEVLLDEKLGFHVALGRSNHFGGIVGPQHFSSPKKVVHIDYVYIQETQPKVKVTKLELIYEHEEKETIMKNNKYTLWS